MQAETDSGVQGDECCQGGVSPLAWVAADASDRQI